MAPGIAEPVPVADLLCGADDLARRLGEALRAGQGLDAYLLAAGLGQLTEDRLHPDPLLLYRAASYLRGRPRRRARLAGTVAGSLGAVARTRAGPAHRRLVTARHALAELATQLGGQILGSGQGAPASVPAAVLAGVRGLDGDVLRLPACFHAFDQHPDDVMWLVDAVLRQYPATAVPVCVLGVRTAGSYLAPLFTAALRAAGAPRAELLTYRPGRPFLRWERAMLAEAARDDGLVLVTDDPPGAGTAMAAAARAVARAGFGDSAIVLVFSSFGDAGHPAALARWPAVVQPWEQWSVHRRLSPPSARQALAGLVGPDTEITEVRPLGPPAQGGDRAHVRARFAVRMTDRRTGESTDADVVAEGAGLGYLGRQGIAVARALPGYVPRVYGFADGFLYRDWLPAAAGPPPADALARTIAGYVAARQRALPAPSASVNRLGGRNPAWEVAARRLSGQYGPLAVPSRPLLLEPAVRRLLVPGQQAVPDGKTDARHWLPGPAGGLRKVDFYQRSFGHLDLACYDPVFDLAGAAADPPAPAFEAQLREAYQRAAGQRVDGERWLLYRLAQLWRLGEASDLTPAQARQRSAAAIHDYLAQAYLRDLPPATGPLCAIDLDGVLECDRLGYPAASPTGVLALRALIAHGYRPVIASGRSLADVGDRCAAFGLTGGIAEYGGALWHGHAAVDLRPASARALLDRARAEVSACPGATADPRYRYGIRAVAGDGPLPAELLSRVPALADPALRVIQGQGQTDITAACLDKGTGLRALAGRLARSGGGAPACALAVGDSPPDLPLFAQASLARVPRNGRQWARSAGIAVTRHAYQAGLADACTALLGHRPGHCPTCRPPGFAPRTRALLAILDLRADGLASMPGRTAELATLIARAAGR
jgi:hydroxymethylpyrimidine pyrophosphatase-like HAD family hydrolase